MDHIRETAGVSSRLAELVMPGPQKVNALAEMAVDGGSIVFGVYTFVGFVDDENKVVYSFSDNLEHSHFYQAYSALVEERGYSVEQVHPQEKQTCPRTGLQYPVRTGPTVLEFLEERGVLEQAEAVLNGEKKPLAGISAVNQNTENSLSGAFKAHAGRSDYHLVNGGLTVKQRVERPVNWAKVKPEQRASRLALAS